MALLDAVGSLFDGQHADDKTTRQWEQSHDTRLILTKTVPPKRIDRFSEQIVLVRNII